MNSDGGLYLANLLESVFKLEPRGQNIISLVQIRDFIIMTTDEAVYKIENGALGGLGFTIRLVHFI